MKKFAKRLPSDTTAYREAFRGGNKAMVRRMKCMKRYRGPIPVEIREVRSAANALMKQVRDLRKIVGDCWK